MPTILAIIFWNFTMFQYRSDLPKVKRNLISNIAKLVCQLPHELPNDLGLQKIRKYKKMSILGGAQFPVSLSEIKLWQQQQQISKFYCSVQFYWISLFCSKYFIRDCLSKQAFGYKTAQCPSNFILFRHFLKLHSISSIFNKNVKQDSRVEIPTLMVLSKHYFVYLVQVKI